DNLEVVLVKIQDNKPSLVTGYTKGYAAPKEDSPLMLHQNCSVSTPINYNALHSAIGSKWSKTTLVGRVPKVELCKRRPIGRRQIRCTYGYASFDEGLPKGLYETHHSRLIAQQPRPVRLLAPAPQASPKNLLVMLRFIPSSTLSSGGIIQKHTSPILSTVVCPRQCYQLFETRDVLVDPVPENAIYNNRQSSRFDGLYGYYRL
ncbi:hypothetical protein OSTOST_23525, partial [Ostertagia ostertagi]